MPRNSCICGHVQIDTTIFLMQERARSDPSVLRALCVQTADQLSLVPMKHARAPGESPGQSGDASSSP
jgi:hypothetical protein